MGDHDDTPPDGARSKRARSMGDRDQYRAKHPRVATDPLGVNIGQSAAPSDVIEFEHTPPPVALPVLPDPLGTIERAALNIQRHSDQIVSRPGPTPTQGSLTVALTLAGFQAEMTKQLVDLKDYINATILEELKADRKVQRDAEAQAIIDKAAWSKLVRDVTLRVVAGLGGALAVLYGILKAIHVL